MHLIHPFTHYSFTHSFMHSVTKSLSRSFVHPFIHPFIHSFHHSFFHSLVHLFINSIIYSSFAVSFVQFVFLISQDYAFKNWSFVGLRPLFFSIVLPWGSRGNTALTNKCGRLLRCKPKMGLQGVTKERKNRDIRMYQSVLFHGAFTKII